MSIYEAIAFIRAWLTDLEATHATVTGPTTRTRRLATSTIEARIRTIGAPIVAVHITNDVARIAVKRAGVIRTWLTISRPVIQRTTWEPVGIHQGVVA